jgi:hypothetical protein
MIGNGKLTYLLRPMRNSRGPYHMGNGNFPAVVDLANAVFFAYPQSDGTLLLSLERYDEKKHGRREEPCEENEDSRCQSEKKERARS